MALLTYETRGELIENEHNGTICVVSERGVEYSVGNYGADYFFRSSSKPIQALPVFLLGLHKKYGLSEAECAIMAGSNAGEKYCTDVVESLMNKAGVTEDDLVMKPRYPSHEATRNAALAAGIPPKKIWHGCTPKHIGAILVQRELTGSGHGYELPDSAVQKMIREIISVFTGRRYENIKLGCDGCGVPVFGTSGESLATAYLRLTCPDLISDKSLSDATAYMDSLMHKYPMLIRGNDYLCTLLNSYENVTAKGGASGVYMFGLKKERLGVMLKILDGTETSWQAIVAEILRQVSPEINAELIDVLDTRNLLGTTKREIYNMTGAVIGELKTAFTLEKH